MACSKDVMDFLKINFNPSHRVKQDVNRSPPRYHEHPEPYP